MNYSFFPRSLKMRINLAAIAACAIAILVLSGHCKAQDVSTCRERNLQALIDRIQISDMLTPERSRFILFKLRHQLKTERMFRERQTKKATQPVNPANEPLGVTYPEWMPDEQGGK
jgi:hypothetical protein